MEWSRMYKKSAIGGSSVTLIPSTAMPGEVHGEAGAISQIVLTTPSTPPAAFWGVATADGREYEVLIRVRT